MMILSAEFSHSPHNQHQTKMAASMLHSPHHLYTGYLSMDHPWHHPVPPPQHLKQEPEDSCNNDSGISPSPYHSDASVQNTSPQSQSGRSEDSGHAQDTLARPVMSSSSPRQSPVSRLSPLQQQLSPRYQQQMSPREETQTNASLGVLARPVMSSPLPSPPQMMSSSPPQLVDKPADDNSRSSVSSAEMDMYYDNPLKGLQMALQRRGMMEPLNNQLLTPEQPVNGEKPLQCPLCQYSTTIRSAFNSHLMREHGEQVSCHLCDFTAENHIRLKEHLRVEHDTTLGPEDETAWIEEEEGVTTPKVNSQGKVKTYRCKQCEFSTVTKLDFWEHTRSHIKPERLLTCPKCPFVTEYKHHLEYHLRNHFGSKPFKCDKCSYSCVNKSMLNSHLKSHSNVYQFRCADCAYATKYCHSLKLHLRKYGHNPAMVLNPDGSPNPLPIVDVYGTRRGPKRPKKSEELVSNQPPTLQGMQSIFPSYGFLPSQAMPYPYGALLGNFPRSPLLPFSNPPPMVQEESAQSKSENNLYNATINTIQQSAINNNQEGVKEYLTRVITTQQEIISRTLETEEEPLNISSGAPLDLSRPDPDPQEQIPESYNDQTPDQSTTIKNRRKGKAFKLERIAQRLQHQSSDEEDCQPSPKQLRFDLSPEPVKDRGSPARDKSPEPMSPAKVDFCAPTDGEFKSTISEERKMRWRNVKEVYDCAYCDMLFGDLVMYTMHMGYHGYQNPYTCNMCGHQTTDKVQFFLHLFRFAHN